MSTGTTLPTVAVEKAKRTAAQIEADEKELVLLTLDQETAFELGQSIRSAYHAQYQHPTISSNAEKESGIAISIQTLNGDPLFSCAAGNQWAISPNTWTMAQRKIEIAKQYNRSSYLVGQTSAAAGRSNDHKVDAKLCSDQGGAVPLRMAGDRISPIAFAVVCGLLPEDNHKLVIEALRKIIKKQQIQASLGGGALREGVPISFAKKQIIVFESNSLFDHDPNEWALESFAPQLRKQMHRIELQTPGEDLFARMLRDLRTLNVSPDQIIAAMRNLPVHPGMIRGIKALHASRKVETTFFLLSASNTLFVNTILEHNGLQPPDGTQIFSEIVASPVKITGTGSLMLERRPTQPVPTDGLEQECEAGCPANGCKWQQLHALLERHGGRQAFDRIIFVGANDDVFCPVLKLGPHDIALIKTGKGLEKMVREQAAPKAGIHWWSGAWEMELLLKQLSGYPVPDIPSRNANS